MELLADETTKHLRNIKTDMNENSIVTIKTNNGEISFKANDEIKLFVNSDCHGIYLGGAIPRSIYESFKNHKNL